jgi:hypothetical protein
MGRVDFTPAVVLLAMTFGVFVLRYASTGQFKGLLSGFDQFISQIFTVPPVSGETQTQTPETETPVTPPTTPSTTTPPTTAQKAPCDCSCMPMDSDPNRWKIETAAGEDCANHEYPDSPEACATLLQSVCTARAGTTPTTTTPAAEEEEEDEEEDEDEDEEEDDDDDDGGVPGHGGAKQNPAGLPQRRSGGGFTFKQRGNIARIYGVMNA